jgi:hypothetical protein
MSAEFPETVVAPADLTDQTLVQDERSRERSRAMSGRRLAAPAGVPGYEISGSLGEGAFGSVWLARELKTGKQVAIKFYTHRRGLDWSLLTREVEKLAVLYTSRNIVGLLDVGWDHDPPYFVMEFLEHGSLATRVEGGALPASEAVRIARAVARALVHAHGSGILHCDLKPANVLLDGNDEPRLGDFGQSRMTTEQSPALGTLFYMAPEQANLNAVPDARWDVYALGALLYHMLTGAPPYRSAETETLIRSARTLDARLAKYREVIAQSPRPDSHRRAPGVDRRLAAIVDGCLQVDPRKRYPNAQVVVDLLDERDEVRAKRPLIALGFLGPLLLLFAMFWLRPQIVRQAQEGLIDRALAGDAVSAELLADGMQQELIKRRESLEDFAAQADVRDLIRSSPDRSRDDLIGLTRQAVANRDLADPSYVAVTERVTASAGRQRAAGRTPDVSWLIMDAQGRQVYRYPIYGNPREPERTTIGVYYDHRDYFHGGGADKPRTTTGSRYVPRRAAGVSVAFRSENTGQYMVAIAAPVWADDTQQDVIGVVARTMHIAELLSQWERLIAGEDASDRRERFLALADASGQPGAPVTLLDHPWMSQGNLVQRASTDDELDKLMAGLKMHDDEADSLRLGDHDARYRDPIAEVDATYAGEWMAAFAPVRGTNWVAIVQEQRAAALAPVGELNRVFLFAGLAALGLFAVLLAVLWYLINRASG